VVGGLYRYVRNPMYLAVIAMILGQAAILGRVALVSYAAILWAIVASFVGFYEEPTLSARYGAQYDAYRRAVRRWWPRATPWRGDHGSTRSEVVAPDSGGSALTQALRRTARPRSPTPRPTGS
jgi:phospholipid methyltransferase